jgi:flagellar assembly protein FliH
MSSEPLSPVQVSELIENLLKSRDAASVTLRRIVKRKQDECEQFPFQKLSFEQFDSNEGGEGVFKKDEIEILKSQKELAEARHQSELEKKKYLIEIDSAYKRGLTEGEAAGRKAGAEVAAKDYNSRIAEIEKRIETMLASALESKRASYSESGRMLLDLSMLIAGKVVAAEISVNPEVVLSVIKKAVSFIADREKMVVRVNSSDLETVSGKKEFWTSIGERLEGIKIESDARIEKGGCIIETSSGAVDARMDVLFQGIKETIDSAWNDLSVA